jgi:hypothetical protein
MEPQNQNPIAQTPNSIPPVQPKSPLHYFIKSIVVLIVLAMIVLVYVNIVGGKRLNEKAKVLENQPIQKFSDADILVTPMPEITASSNATTAFATLKPLAQEDFKSLTDYIASSTTTLPPLSASQKLLTKYSDYLKVFDQNSIKTFYCKDGSCSLNAIRSALALVTLRSLVNLEQGKNVEAQKDAANVIAVGKSLTANNDNIVTMLIGWVAQKYGYTALSLISKKNPAVDLSDEQKQELIATLRNEHKYVMRFEYTKNIELVDYINSVDKLPKYSVMDADAQSTINEYRNAIAQNPAAWNFLETKKYFYDTTKNMLAHIDLPCGATIPDSLVQTGFNEQNTNDKNYIGKTMYAIGGASLDSLNSKRCEVESAIQPL